MTVGIYTITHRTNGKVYVGLSSDVERRFTEHRKNMRAATPDNLKGGAIAMWNDCRADKDKAFIFAIVATVSAPALATLDELEKEWERKLRVSGTILYNAKACGGVSAPHSAETLALLSALPKRPVVNLDTNEVYPCSKDAALALGLNPNAIGMAFSKGVHVGGFRWALVGNEQAQITRYKLKSKRKKPVKDLLTGETFDSAAMASTARGLSRNAINEHMRKVPAGKARWVFVEEHW